MPWPICDIERIESVPALVQFATFEDSQKRTLTTTFRTAWQKHREQLNVGSAPKDAEGC
jgi:hypothetical protein